MAHFCKLDENNTVAAVIVVANEKLLDGSGQESEAVGIAFLTAWSGGYDHWKQTSYNGNFRKNYASVGDTYDAQRDAFIAPKPEGDFVLDENTCQWVPL